MVGDTFSIYFSPGYPDVQIVLLLVPIFSGYILEPMFEDNQYLLHISTRCQFKMVICVLSEVTHCIVCCEPLIIYIYIFISYSSHTEVI